MRTIVFGDVHGNLPAFELMLRHAGAVERYVCLGDVVNYGPWSNECVQLLETLPNCDRLMGNHDQAFLDGVYLGRHPLAQKFFRHCFPAFTELASLARYAASSRVGDFRAQHTLHDDYVYADTPLALDDNYLIGHSHHQFRRESNGRVLFNAGSVGQNRRYLNVIDYLLCGPGPGDIRMVNLIYDVAPVLAAMRGAGYPPECLAYYENKPRA